MGGRRLKLMKSIVDKNYWENHWQKIKFEIAPQNHPIRQWIELKVPETNYKTCLEIGYYPGKFLAVFGEKGYVLNGIDFFTESQNSSILWLKKCGYNIGSFYKSDLWDFKVSESYDIVCSFGLIEHFKNWKEVLNKHIELTKTAGTIMIDVPNLNSFLYRFLYKLFEPRVLKNHESSAMNISNICHVFKENKCDIKKADYFGYFYFRFVTRHDKISVIVSKIINIFRPIFELLPKSIYMRYIVILAVKQ